MKFATELEARMTSHLSTLLAKANLAPHSHIEIYGKTKAPCRWRSGNSLEGRPDGEAAQHCCDHLVSRVLCCFNNLASISWVTSDEPSDVIFDNKVFYDSGQTAVGDGVVSISGSLTGEGVGNKNNTVTVTCYQDRMECLAYSIAQIGPNQLGKLEVPGIFPITKWDNYEIVAVESGDTVACRKATVSIERKTETAVWVEDPINQTQPACKDGAGP